MSSARACGWSRAACIDWPWRWPTSPGSRGAVFRYGAEVDEILVDAGRVSGVRLASGEQIETRAVIANADVGALAGGRLGAAAARAIAPTPRARRSLSALTWCVHAPTEGFPLLRHNVFFSSDYAAEFDDLFRRARLPAAPTVYVCAQDRGEADDAPPAGPERLLCLVNAPPTGDSHRLDATEIRSCEERTFGLLARSGLQVALSPETTRVTTPADFERLFPGSGGALYGPVSHGSMASFRRPTAQTRIRGPLSRGWRHAPGSGRPDGGAVGAAGCGAACLGTGLRSADRTRRLRVVVRGRAERRRPPWAHPDRPDRQRLLALLCPGTAAWCRRSARSLRAQRGALRRRREALGAHRARPPELLPHRHGAEHRPERGHLGRQRAQGPDRRDHRARSEAHPRHRPARAHHPHRSRRGPRCEAACIAGGRSRLWHGSR